MSNDIKCQKWFRRGGCEGELLEESRRFIINKIMQSPQEVYSTIVKFWSGKNLTYV